jgi:hypothetical protein
VSLQGIRKALPALEGAQTNFETYERQLWAFECQAASEAIIALLADLRDVIAPTAESIVPFDYTREQAEEARLLLAAYTPHAGSVALRYLRLRQQVAETLRRVVEAARRVLATCQDRPRPQRTHPASVRLLPVPANRPGHHRRMRSQRQSAATRRRLRVLHRKGRSRHAGIG